MDSFSRTIIICIRLQFLVPEEDLHLLIIFISAMTFKISLQKSTKPFCTRTVLTSEHEEVEVIVIILIFLSMIYVYPHFNYKAM